MSSFGACSSENACYSRQAAPVCLRQGRLVLRISPPRESLSDLLGLEVEDWRFPVTSAYNEIKLSTEDPGVIIQIAGKSLSFLKE